MHGFTQQVLPLSIASEAPSPAGKKPNGTDSQSSSEHLLQLYRELPNEQKTLVRLKALIEPAANKTVFHDAAHRAGWRTSTSKTHALTLLNTDLQILQRKGLINGNSGCVPGILHAVAVDACASGEAANLIGAVKAAIPKSGREEAGRPSYYYLPALSQDVDLFRHFRLAIYANDEAEFLRLRKIVEDAEPDSGGHPMLNLFLGAFPLSQAWLERLHPAIREMFALYAIRMVLDHGEQTAETLTIVQHYAAAAPGEAGTGFNELLVRFDILSANFARAQQRIAALPESEAHLAAACEASIAFLTGHNDAALDGFRNGLKLLRKSRGRRKVAFDAEAGLFHMLALLRASDPALHAELRGLIDAATMEVTPFYLAHRGIGALLDLVEGRYGQAEETVKHLLEQPSACPAASSILALAALFADVVLARKCTAQNQAEYNRLAQTMPVLARIRAEVLSKTARDGTSWRERAAELGGKDIVTFTEIVPFKQPWERAFDTLTAFLKPEERARPAEKAPAKAKRLAWLVDLSNGEVTVVEQSPKGSGWTGGRPVALKRLHQRDGKLDYMTDHDRRMCHCVRKEQSWYDDEHYLFRPLYGAARSCWTSQRLQRGEPRRADRIGRLSGGTRSERDVPRLQFRSFTPRQRAQGFPRNGNPNALARGGIVEETPRIAGDALR